MNPILIVDDCQNQLNFLKTKLSNYFFVDIASNAFDALKACKTTKYEAIIVDLHMPIMNGIDFIKEYRHFNTEFKNIFILSTDCSQNAKIEALNLGINDFLWPEMDDQELVLRISNQINHSKNSVEYKKIKINFNDLVVFVDSRKIDFTLIEFKILKTLICNANKVILRDDLKKLVWPDLIVQDKTLNTHLTNLRGKIEGSETEIKSIKNEGILFS
jgi:two-component system alkaline phosphatase synthesis response regulator PhoP